MAKYVIDESTLQGLANAIRTVTGSTKRFTPDEMINEVANILNATTFILVDQDGREYPAVWVESDTVCNATANDIRKGSVAITPEGVIEGTKEIPAYHTTEGYKLIPAGSELKVTGITHYDYTKLQALICAFNSTIADSVSTEKVCVGDEIYPVNSTDVVSTVSIEADKKAISFGIVNDGESPVVIRYFTYKEIY